MPLIADPYPGNDELAIYVLAILPSGNRSSETTKFSTWKHLSVILYDHNHALLAIALKSISYYYRIDNSHCYIDSEELNEAMHTTHNPY